MSQLGKFFIYFFIFIVSFWLGTFFFFISAIHSVGEHGDGVVFHRKWRHHEHRPPTLLNALPKGTLRGNRKVSLSRGFVKCNIIGGWGGRDAGEKGRLCSTERVCCYCPLSHITIDMCDISLNTHAQHIDTDFHLVCVFFFLDRLFIVYTCEMVKPRSSRCCCLYCNELN